MTPRRRAFVLRRKNGGVSAGRGHPALGDTANAEHQHHETQTSSPSYHQCIAALCSRVFDTYGLPRYVSHSEPTTAGYSSVVSGSDFNLNSPAVLPQQQNQELFFRS